MSEIDFSGGSFERSAPFLSGDDEGGRKFSQPAEGSFSDGPEKGSLRSMTMSGKTPVSEALKGMLLSNINTLYVAQEGLREGESADDFNVAMYFRPLSLPVLVRLFNICPMAPIEECLKDTEYDSFVAESESFG